MDKPTAESSPYLRCHMRADFTEKKTFEVNSCRFNGIFDRYDIMHRRPNERRCEVKIIRVFPRKTSCTPIDEDVRINTTPDMFDDADEVHISVSWTGGPNE